MCVCLYMCASVQVPAYTWGLFFYHEGFGDRTQVARLGASLLEKNSLFEN
jgi:hypothetical protein